MTLWHENLHRIIAKIDALMPQDKPSTNNSMADYHKLQAYQANVRSVILQLVEAEGGWFSQQGDTLRLRLAGVQSTCTHGPSGLVTNWQTAARRKLAEAYPHTEENCPGHVGSDSDKRICGRCGVHIDDLRPDDDPINLQGSGPAPIAPRVG